jgi:uncharacterized caspase-like protein
LRSPANDARAVADALRRLGFDVTLALDLDYRGMREALLGFGRTLSGARIATFYYAGHALNLTGENYLVPIDAAIRDEASIPFEAVSLNSAFDALDRATGGKIVILDANRENIFATNLARSSGTRSSGVKSGLAATSLPEQSIVLAASAPGTVASDGSGVNSVLTPSLIRHLASPDVDVSTAMRRVRDEVARATQDRQSPWLQSTLSGELRLADPPGNQTAKPSPAPVPPPAVEVAALEQKLQATLERFQRERLAAAQRAERERLEQERYQSSFGDRNRQAFEQERRRRDEIERTARERAEIERLLSELNTLRNRSSGVEPAPQQPPPPPPATAATDDQVARYPTIEAADRVVAGETTTVLVSLTVDKLTPDVKVHATGDGTTKMPDGALGLPMPADAARMEVKVVMRAAGFDLDPATPEEATIEVTRDGDSTVARFRITARPDAVGARSLRVTLWRDNEFLANMSRRIEIVPARPVAAEHSAPSGRTSAARAAPLPQKALAPSHAIPPDTLMHSAMPSRLSADAQVAVLRRPRPIDLKIEIVYDDAGGLGRGRVTIATDYLGRMRHGEINTPPSIVGWLEEFYREFRNLSSRGGHSADAPDEDSREARIGRLRAFGEELYRRAAPPVLKAALAELLDNPQVELRTVQIYSNNPVIPWELMRAPKESGGSTDFFGITFALARWHEDDEPRMILRPPQDQRIDEVVAVAPAYRGGQSLGAQSREIDEIQALLATRRVSGKRSDFMSLVRNPPRGVIHFAGHGEIAGRSAVERRFAIQLEDGAFDVMDWRGVAGGQNRERALFFFNACDIGQAESVAGAVEGWAPAVLARGAAGYIGGLWPLKDDPAARFAVAFYRAVAKRLAENGEASVAGALSDARKLFYETADPTYLGYAFYGDAQLALVRR